MNISKEKKTPQDHISSIFEEYNTPSRVLRSFTNLSNTVIQTSLSGQNKFLFEILQNADDSFENENQPIEIYFRLHQDYLIVQHNGKAFDYNDIERICDYASQIEEVKATDLSKTGYKGLGFKSLFNLSDCIYIYSNSYSIRFDKNFWHDPSSRPWQVIPIWCRYDELPLNVKYTYDQPVNFIFKINDMNILKNHLNDLVENSELLLFLNHIDKLNIDVNGKKHFLKREVEKSGVFKKVSIYINQQVKSTWILKTYTQPVSARIQNSIQGASQFIYPDKIKRAKEIPLTFALRSNKAIEKISNIKGFCYSTLPTQLNLNLPYHTNSYFILNLDRSQLHENEWNAFLIYQIGRLQLSLLKDLAGLPHLKNYVINLLTPKINHPYTAFNTAFLRGFNEVKDVVDWIPAYQGLYLLKIRGAWIDETGFFRQNFECIRNRNIQPCLIDYDVKNQSSLPSETQRFTFDNLFEDFPKVYYSQLTQTSYREFIEYLYNLKDNYCLMRKLSNVFFLKGKNQTLLSPNNALLEESTCPIPHFFKLNLVDNDSLPSNNSMIIIKNWLETLGAKRLRRPIEVLRESVFKWIESGTFSYYYRQNHFEIVTYIAKDWEQLAYWETSKLRENLLLLSESKQFKLASSCYFPDVVNGLEFFFTDDDKISSCYNVSSLRRFLLHLGVKDKLDHIDVVRKIITWIKNGEVKQKINESNYISVIKYLSRFYPSVDYNLTDSEKEMMKMFPVLTCNRSFQEAQYCYFESALPKVKLLECVVERNKLVSIEILNKDEADKVNTFLTKIGVSEYISHYEVLRKTVLKWIQEGCIHNKITMDNHISVFNYIAENCNSIFLDSDEKLVLKKFPILTENNTFREACNCYISTTDDDKREIPGLKAIISANELVLLGCYPENKRSVLEDLGVKKLRFSNVYEKYSDHLACSENITWFFNHLVSYWSTMKSSINKGKLLKYLQEKFKSSPCLLARNDRIYHSTKLYSSQFDNIYSINPNCVPLLKYKKLPEDLEKWLGFKLELDLNCIMQLLEAIRKNPELGKEKTLTFFTVLLQQLRKKEEGEIKKYQLSLLSKENKLIPAKDLCYFKEEESICYKDSCYLKRIEGMSHNDTLELAKLCGVKIMEFNQNITYGQGELIPDDTLKQFYLARLPFIVLQESKKANESTENSRILKQLYSKIYFIELYRCPEICIEYPFGSQKRRLHYENLKIYVTSEWHGRQRSLIHEYLQKKLCLKTDIRKIIDMQLNSEEINDWLQEENEDENKLHCIMEQLQELISKGESALIIDEETDSFCSTDEKYNSSDDELSNEKLADLTEMKPQHAGTMEKTEACGGFIDKIENISDIVSTHSSEYRNLNRNAKGFVQKKSKLNFGSTHDLQRENVQLPERPSNLFVPAEETMLQGFFHSNITKHCVKWLRQKYVFTFLQNHNKMYQRSQFQVSDGLLKLSWQPQYESTNNEEERYDAAVNDPSFLNQNKLDDCFHKNKIGDELCTGGVLDVNNDQPLYSKIKENNFKIQKKEQFTDLKFYPDENSAIIIIEVESNKQFQYVIKVEESGIYGQFIDESEGIQSYQAKYGYKDDDVIKIDRRELVQNNLEIYSNLVNENVQEKTIQKNLSSLCSSTANVNPKAVRFFKSSNIKRHYIKWLSETYVFSFLQNHYEKYPNSQFRLFNGLLILQWQPSHVEIPLNESENKLEIERNNEIKTNTREIMNMEVNLENNVEMLQDENDDSENLCFAELKLQEHYSKEIPHFHNEKINHNRSLRCRGEKPIAKKNISSNKSLIIEVEPCLQIRYAIKVQEDGVCGEIIDELDQSNYETIYDYKDMRELFESNSEYNSNNIIDCILRRFHLEKTVVSYSSAEATNFASLHIFQDVNLKKDCIKWLGEKYVFIFLQDHYKNKYPDAECNISDGKFKLFWQPSHKIEIVWLNESEEKGHPYDILIEKDGEIKQIIEVESSDAADQDSFNMSHHEFLKRMNYLALEYPRDKEKYCIYRIFNVHIPQITGSDYTPFALYQILPLKTA